MRYTSNLERKKGMMRWFLIYLILLQKARIRELRLLNVSDSDILVTNKGGGMSGEEKSKRKQIGCTVDIDL